MNDGADVGFGAFLGVMLAIALALTFGLGRCTKKADIEDACMRVGAFESTTTGNVGAFACKPIGAAKNGHEK